MTTELPHSALTQSVQAVGQIMTDFQGGKPGPVTITAREEGTLSANICAVSEALDDAEGAVSEDPAQASLGLLSSMRTLSLSVARGHPPTLAVSQEPSLTYMLRRVHDENMHSDFLAALLSTDRVGEFANHVLGRLIEHAEGEGAAGATEVLGWQTAHREIRLDELDVSLTGGEIGARRIDVLVHAGDCVVVIENKTFTGESENQTTDYAQTVQERYGGRKRIYMILLSPSGMRAQSKAFVPLSYGQLYQLLADARLSGNPDRAADRLAGDYLQCLAHDFLREGELSLRACIEDLKENGYDI
jgi:hypothetical protein